MQRIVIQTQRGLNDLANTLHRAKRFSMDYEFEPKPWVLNPEMAGCSFAIYDGTEYKSWYYPVRHKIALTQKAMQLMPEGAFWEKMKPILEDPNKTKVTHSGETESGFSIVRGGVELGDNLRDTMLGSWLYDEEALYPYRLKEVVPKCLGRNIEKLEKLVNREAKDGGKSRDIRLVTVEEAAVYGTNDSIHTLMLDEWFEPQLKAQGLWDVYINLEIPIIRVIRDMVRTGVHMDMPKIRLMHECVVSRVAQLEQEIYQEAGEEFNINSRPQLGKVLFERLGYPHQGMTDGGKSGKKQYKTSDEVMVALANLGYPVAEMLREHGDLKKLDGTYLSKWMETVIGQIYYASFWQAGTVTGRYSSDFQQVPRYNPQEIRVLPIPQESKALAAKIAGARLACEVPETCEIVLRETVTAPPGENLAVGDFNQVELRLLSHFSRDPVLVACYERGEDLHEGTAGSVRESALAASKSKEPNYKHGTEPEMGMIMDPRAFLAFPRQDAKPMNFGLVYGLALPALQETFGMYLGKLVYDSLNERFGGMFAYKKAFIHQAHLDEYATTLFGRRRRLPEINSDDWMLRGYAERQAFNTKIQGSAADLVKFASLMLYRKLPEARQCMQVHDELAFRIKGTPKFAESVRVEIKRLMEGCIQLSIPMIAEVKLAKNWKEAK